MRKNLVILFVAFLCTACSYEVSYPVSVECSAPEIKTETLIVGQDFEYHVVYEGKPNRVLFEDENSIFSWAKLRVETEGRSAWLRVARKSKRKSDSFERDIVKVGIISGDQDIIEYLPKGFLSDHLDRVEGSAQKMLGMESDEPLSDYPCWIVEAEN